ncbi:short chain dehydrogenase domain-containing protein [Ditylenchus destructor]|uniref:Short chain dehydrogenase domain-containing protein n=1 Tax=Ditylenchus destructor TaxID=166010 RepID=A0AAD4R1G1_9BILA|nr:short chain dehydrogenase domain-containing protein [Ditylenchus destructor]
MAENVIMENLTKVLFSDNVQDVDESPVQVDYLGGMIKGAVILAVCIMFAQLFSECLNMLVKFFYYILLGCIKALLPCGVLPRKSVKDQIVLITGTGMGLGRLLAVQFGKLGARLVLWDINEEQNLETKKMLDDIGVEAHAYTIDLSSKDQIYATAEKVRQEVGDVDILFNNAGIVTGKKLFDCPDALMEKTMSINANSLFYTAKCFVPKMIEKNSGHVITVASMAGHVGVNGLVDYCASKHAAVGFNEALRGEIRCLGKSVHVTTVCPYFINTGMFNGVKTYAPLWFPILEPEYVIYRIMEAVLTNEENLYLPRASHLFLLIKGLLPSRAVFTIAEYFGLNRSMDEYVGRNQNK